MDTKLAFIDITFVNLDSIKIPVCYVDGCYLYEKDKKDRHIKLYKALSSLMDDIVKNIPNEKQLCFANCVKRGNGGYKEAAFFHYNLDFSNWDRDKDIITKSLKDLNDKFIERFEKEIKPNF